MFTVYGHFESVLYYRNLRILIFDLWSEKNYGSGYTAGGWFLFFTCLINCIKANKGKGMVLDIVPLTGVQ